MRRALIIVMLTAGAGCRPAASAPSFLFVWAGDSARTASDFLAVIDANPGSAGYGSVVSSLATGMAGTHPHHTEAMMPANGHLLANGFATGRTWLFDLTKATEPKILGSFGDLAGFSHPHTYIRLTNGHVLATFQYRADSSAPAPSHEHGAMAMGGTHSTGGLVEMDEAGKVIRGGSAVDRSISYRGVFPYSVLAMPGIDRALSTTTNMDEADTSATSEWVQLWRLSDLTLLQSFALAPGPHGDEHRYTGEPFLLPDGKSVYVHTFNCGLYLVRNLETPRPTASFVRSFPGKGCGVPVLTGHYWLQPVPDVHGLVALDIADPEHPREVSSVQLGADEQPHWLAIDGTGRRLVVNSAGAGAGNRLFVVDFDPGTGALAVDAKFRDPGSARPGIKLTAKRWPHGFTGTAVPHGTVFSR